MRTSNIRYSLLQGRRIALDLRGIAGAIRALPVAVAVKCHSPHMFSRRARNQSYRNLIKRRRYAALAVQLGVQRNQRPNRDLARFGRLLSKCTLMKSLYL